MSLPFGVCGVTAATARDQWGRVLVSPSLGTPARASAVCPPLAAFESLTIHIHPTRDHGPCSGGPSAVLQFYNSAASGGPKDAH